MRAAVVSAFQAPPEVADRPEPAAREGQAVVELLAAALNPADLAIASGSFPAGNPPLPYVPGIEGVGTVVESARFAAGTRVWASGRGFGVAFDGAFSERFAVADEVLVEVPEAASDIVAAALGQVGLAAWMSLSWRAPVRPGEVVLVLGATGSVGSVAVQAAKLLGAGRVIAAGRDAARLEAASALGADATVSLEGDDVRERLAEAAADGPPTLVLDALYGPPLEAALAVVGPGRASSTSASRPRRRSRSRRGSCAASSSSCSATPTSPCRSTRSRRATRTWSRTRSPAASASTPRRCRSIASARRGRARRRAAT